MKPKPKKHFVAYFRLRAETEDELTVKSGVITNFGFERIDPEHVETDTRNSLRGQLVTGPHKH